MKRAILLILDGLGIGAMDDLIENERSQDKGANTLNSILKNNPGLDLAHLAKLGLGTAADNERLMTERPAASYGQARLNYKGADTFMGHQEIMGSKVKPPKIIPFKNIYKKVKESLKKKGYQVKACHKPLPYLVVEESVVIADNIEADYGQIYNVTAALDEISFSSTVKIARVVREIAKVSRVIALGGPDISPEQIRDNIVQVSKDIAGVKTTNLNIYGPQYKVLHLGYGIDHKQQITSIMAKNGYDVRLIGKVQDVINCPQAKEMIPEVYTEEVLKKLVSKLKEVEQGLIAANVQELDLAGHEQKVKKQGEVLKIVDDYLPAIIENLQSEDILIITADHGNDARLDTTKHTRERTPILLYSPQANQVRYLGIRETLADIAATIADYFAVDKPQSGQSFLK
ncbi:MAG: phosphopentomutase [Halanaerobiales bacterium]